MTRLVNSASVAVELFQQAVDAANPERAMLSCRRDALNESLSDGRLFIISVGKAAVPMMRGALAQVAEGQCVDALVVTNYENKATIAGVEVLLAGHPIPDANGVTAANAVIQRLQSATQKDCVVALISGGASALLPAPVDGVSLEDKAEVNRLLMRSGFEIYETNLVRQQLSLLKGGGFNQLAAPAPVCAYILSDVIGDDLRVIGSGLTASAIGDRAAALEVLRAEQVKMPIPQSVLEYLSRVEPKVDSCDAENHLIGSNHMSLMAAADRARVLGWQVTVVDAALVGSVSTAAEKVASAIASTPRGEKNCLLFGGETSVLVRGSGKGGRNQEMALRVAIRCESCKGSWVFLSGGTDGRDGPTDAAGGLVEAGSVSRMRAAGVDPDDALRHNDSYHALQASRDLLLSGATGTNVADIQIALIP